MSVAGTLTRQERFDEAESILRRAEELTGDESTDDLLEEFALLYEKWGRPSEAAPYRERLSAVKGG